MNTDITLYQEGKDHAALMASLGFSGAMKSENTGVSFPRLRIMNKPIMGVEEVKGKKKSVALVDAGSFRLALDGDKYVYAQDIKFRPFLQQFMIKRFNEDIKRKGADGKLYDGEWMHTVMTPEENPHERIDDHGGVNCGKPSGWIGDFKSLPKETKDLISSCKRTRVLFGTVELVDPTDEKGEEVDNPGPTPCIWEVGGSGYKPMAEPFKTIVGADHLPLQHVIELTTEHNKNGDVEFYTPVSTVDLESVINITDEDQTLINEFMSYVEAHNKRIKDKHLTAAREGTQSQAIDVESVEEEDKAIFEAQFVDVSKELE